MYLCYSYVISKLLLDQDQSIFPQRAYFLSSRNSSSIIRTRIDRVLVQLYNKDKLDRVHIGAAGLGIIIFFLCSGGQQ